MSSRRKLLVTLAVVGVLTAALSVVFSSFTSVTKSEGNTFSAGSITLTDNDGDSALFSLTGLEPTDTASQCLTVNLDTTEGLTSNVKLYGATADSGLAEHLNVTITRGTQANAPQGTTAEQLLDCAGFEADVDGVLFEDSLAAYPDSEAAGIADPDAAWGDGDSAVYKIDVSLDDTDDAQGGDVEQEFTFKAYSNS